MSDPIGRPAGLAAMPDTIGMVEATFGLPEQLADAVSAVEGVAGLDDAAGIANVVVTGMGGSGIAGDVLAAVAGQFCSVPVTVIKGYDAPSFVGPASLVIAVSFSGDTEETVQAATEAQLAGARMVAVCRGGRLGELAAEWGAPVLGLPDGIPKPRAGIGALAVPPMIALERLGLFPGAHHWVAAAVDQLRRRRDELSADDNPAERLARRLGRSLPLIHGAGDVGAVAAARWKAQCNENAKIPAFAATVPELCHNDICGWGQHGDITRQVFALVQLRHDEEHPQEARRFELVTDLMAEVVGGVHTVTAGGDGILAQLFDLMFFGDVVSLALAAQEGLDPGPIPVLDELKAALARPVS